MYHYARFSDSNAQIRLICFVGSGEVDSHRDLSLTVFDLLVAPSYNAISYTWGDSDDEEVINIDGAVRNVRVNCLYALEQAYHQQPTAWYWIDSICINQEDPLEKAQQVQMMWKIYRKAARVLACIGPARDDSDLLAALSRSVDRHYDTRGTVQDWIPWLDPLEAWSYSDLKSAFDQFAHRQYWNRLWIVQELAAAQRVSVLCGTHAISWHAIVFFVDRFGVDLQEYSSHGHAHTFNSSPLETIVLFEGDSALDVGYIFTNFGGFRCTDPRDRLFGVLHLIAWPDGIAPVLPDYTKSAFELALKMCSVIEISRVEDMLVAFQIDAAHPEFRGFIEHHLELCYTKDDVIAPCGLFKDVYDTFRFSQHEQGEIQAKRTTCACIREDENGRLTAPFWTSAAIDETTFDEFMQCSHALLSSTDISVFRLRHRPRPIVHGDDVLALVHHDAQEGDVLIQFGQDNQGILLVLRPNETGTHDVVGQGITAPGHSLDPRNRGGFSESSFFDARVRVYLTAEDMLSLIGQDLDMRDIASQCRPLPLRLQRLDTRPLLFPRRAVTVQPMTEDL